MPPHPLQPSQTHGWAGPGVTTGHYVDNIIVYAHLVAG